MPAVQRRGICAEKGESEEQRREGGGAWPKNTTESRLARPLRKEDNGRFARPLRKEEPHDVWAGGVLRLQAQSAVAHAPIHTH